MLFSFSVVSDVVHSGILEGPVTWLDLTLSRGRTQSPKVGTPFKLENPSNPA